MSGPAPELGAVATAVGEPLAARLREGAADLRPVAVPGLPDGAIWLVIDEFADHPLAVHVGRWSDGSLGPLSGDEAAFGELVADIGASIDDEETAVGFIRALLAIGRDPMVHVRELGGPADVPWRPGSDAEERRREAFERDRSIEATHVERTATGYRVAMTLVVDQRIQRNRFDVAPDGTVDATFEVLADDLPLPIVR
jgi:hypothetical protein